MLNHINLDDYEVRQGIRAQLICLGGNRKLKIYGVLQCASGKKMKKKNRVFFESEQKAVDNGYRPCGHCLVKKYKIWKKGL